MHISYMQNGSLNESKLCGFACPLVHENHHFQIHGLVLWKSAREAKHMIFNAATTPLRTPILTPIAFVRLPGREAADKPLYKR